MSSQAPKRPAPGWFRSSVSLLWVVVVSAAFCLVYAPALADYVGVSAARFPLLERILDWMKAVL